MVAMLFHRIRTLTGAISVAALLLSAVPARSAMIHSPHDLAFATKARQGDTAEVADAKLALQTTRNQRVDAFANRMITDHSKANARLAAIMRRQGIPAAATIGSKNQTTYNRIEALTGHAFDVAYLSAQKTAHDETIDLFKREIRSGSDPQLVGFAKATLPVLKMHRAMLRTIRP